MLLRRMSGWPFLGTGGPFPGRGHVEENVDVLGVQPGLERPVGGELHTCATGQAFVLSFFFARTKPPPMIRRWISLVPSYRRNRRTSR